MHIQKYINDKLKYLSPNTVLKHLANISNCLNDAIEKNIILYNPAYRVRKPKKVRYTGAKHYKEKQIEKLLECSRGDPLEILIFLTIFYGLSRSEVLGLKWDAVDFDDKTIQIKHTVVKVYKNIYKLDSTKNHIRRAKIHMPEIINDKLKEWQTKQNRYKTLQPDDYAETGYICTGVDGNLIKPDYVSQHFQVLIKRNNLPIIRFHDLRHSSANYLRHLGYNLKEIQIWFRHSNISTTGDIYMDLDMDERIEIGNRLNKKFKKLSSQGILVDKMVDIS